MASRRFYANCLDKSHPFMSKPVAYPTIAQWLDEAQTTAQARPQLGPRHALSIDQAYAVQAELLIRRYQRGEQFIGVKMGFTSRAKMEQMGVHDMIWGRLTDAMQIPDGGSLNLGQFIHPRVEPEICFRLKKDLNQAVDRAGIEAYVDGIAPALEVIDSRYQNFKFSLTDVIADNCSSAALVLGPWKNPTSTLDSLPIELHINGEIKHAGTGAAILGDPWESVVAASRLCEQYQQELPAGSIIMAGAATAAVFLQPGDQVVGKMGSLGEVGFGVE